MEFARLARSAGGQAGDRLDGIEDLAEAGSIHNVLGNIEVSAIEDIENLGAKLDLGGFGHAEIAQNGEIAASQSRTTQDVPPGIAEGKPARRAEGRGQHPLLRGLLAGVKRRARDVRAIRIGLHRGVIDLIRAADVSAHDRSERRARLDGEYAPNLPALNQVVKALALELRGGSIRRAWPK